NGTGYLDVDDITVPADGTSSIVFEVTIDGGADPGDLVANTATVSNPNGPGATPSAPTITVSQSLVPASGNKLLYAYDTQSLTRTPQPASASSGVLIPGIHNTDTSSDW